jgi:hypothetical protein
MLLFSSHILVAGLGSEEKAAGNNTLDFTDLLITSIYLSLCACHYQLITSNVMLCCAVPQWDRNWG